MATRKEVIKTAKIIIADDKEGFRGALKDMLTYNSFTVSGEASNGRELLRILESRSCDILLLDLQMPVMDGCKTFNFVRQRFPAIKIIIISLHDDQVLMDDYIERGAKGFLPKDSCDWKGETLLTAVNTVAEGRIYTSPKRKDEMRFTRKQREMMPLLFGGLTNEMIGEQMGISKRAVEKHRQNLYERLGLERMVDFYKFAFARGLQFLGRREVRK